MSFVVRRLLSAAAVATVLSAPAGALAVPIAGLYATGVDNGGNVLANAASDPHYTIVNVAGTPSGVVINQANIPGSWVANNATSRWIWETATGLPVGVTRIFRTAFDLTGFDLGTVSIAGTWSTDNFGDDVRINGVGTSQTCGGFGGFCNFTLNTGFVAGINTIDFVVRDVGSISGFRVGAIAGTGDLASGVPEPAPLAAVAIGLLGLAAWRRRRATVAAARAA